MKKRILAGMMAAVLVVSLGTTSVFAASPNKGCNYGRGCNYVDADGDGVCDNYGNGCNYVDADGDGICDNCGRENTGLQNGTGKKAGQNGRNQGRNYVDADGDGVCDNLGTQAGNGNGCGKGNGCRGGRNR